MKLPALVVSAALFAAACTAANVPSSTETRTVTNVGSLQVERPTAPEPRTPVGQPAEVNPNPRSADPNSGRSPEMPKIKPPPVEPPGPASTAQPGRGDRCSRGSDDSKELRPMCIAQ